MTTQQFVVCEAGAVTWGGAAYTKTPVVPLSRLGRRGGGQNISQLFGSVGQPSTDGHWTQERPTEPMQGVRGAKRAFARTSALGANARSAGGRASVSTSAGGADARSAGGRASARTSAKGANARSAMRRRTSRCRPDWRSSRECHRKCSECG